MAQKTLEKKRKSVDGVADASKTSKKARKVTTTASPANGAASVAPKSIESKSAAKGVKPKKIKKEKSKPLPKAETVQADFTKLASGSDDSADEEIEDDQAAALLAGFESSDDDDENAANDEGGDDGADAAEKQVPALPDSEELQKQLSAAAKSGGDAPGTIYVGRLPHGFYEHQMKAYFSQFGEISRLRMAHNRRTGASKHYAFVEFSSAEVAKVVADTMDSYLMYGHILKVKYLAPEKIHEKLWEGAGKRFRKIPWNRIEKNKLEKVARKGWEKRVGKEERRRQSKQEKLAALGYTYEAPKLRSVDEVAVKPTQTEDVETTKTIEPAPETNNTIEELLNGKQKAMQEPEKETVEAATAAAAAAAKNANNGKLTAAAGMSKAGKPTKRKVVKA